MTMNHLPGSGIQRRPALIWPFALGLLASLSCGAVGAQSAPPPAGGPYVISKQVIASGAEESTGGPYRLTGTVAQAATDLIPASANDYQLSGGFHTPSVPRNGDVFADGFEQ